MRPGSLPGREYLFSRGSTSCVAGDDVADAVLSACRHGAAVGEIKEIDMPRAVAIQRLVVSGLYPSLGGVVRCKATLGNVAAQARFDASGSVMGVSLAVRLDPPETVFELAWGVDLWLGVGDPSSNQARARAELIDALDDVIAFVEVPDRLAARHVALDAAAVTAISAGAHYGVSGRAVTMAPDLDWAGSLGRLRVGAGDGDLISAGTLPSTLVAQAVGVYRFIHAGLGTHRRTALVGYR